MKFNHRKGGKPLKFTKEKMEEGILAYFKYCSIDECGYPLGEEYKPPTITGLACYLNTTRDLLLDYEEREEFSDTIKKAKQRIEAYNEAMLYSKGVSTAGVIFNLKNNYGWCDRAELKSSLPKDYSPVHIVLPDNGR